MVLDTFLLNTQHYKLHLKGKVEQFRERGSALPYTSVLKLMKREPLTKVTNNYVYKTCFYRIRILVSLDTIQAQKRVAVNIERILIC